MSRSDSCRWKRGEGLSRSHLRAVPAIPCEPQISGFLCVHCRQRGHSSFQRVVSLREGCSTSQSLGLAPVPAPGSLPSSALCNTAPQLGPRHVGGLWWSREWNPSPSPPQEPEPSPEAPQDIHSSSTPSRGVLAAHLALPANPHKTGLEIFLWGLLNNSSREALESTELLSYLGVLK